MISSIRPAANWFALLRSWQVLAAFCGILFYEAHPLFLPEYQLIEQSFDAIESGQLYFEHGIDLGAWISPFVTMALVQLFLALTLPLPNERLPGPRLWLWALLCGLIALCWTGVVLLVDIVGLTWANGTNAFDFLFAENSAVALLGVLLLPIVVWQIGGLHSGPPLTIRDLWQNGRADWPAWLFSFALLQAVFVAASVLAEKLAVLAFDGQPLWGYLLMTVFYSANLVGIVTFQFAAFRRFRFKCERIGRVFN